MYDNFVKFSIIEPLLVYIRVAKSLKNVILYFHSDFKYIQTFQGLSHFTNVQKQ